MRNVFGWSLPPGCTNRMIDEQAGIYDACAVCGRYCDDCICPECPVCSGCGDLTCYEVHGLERTPEQIASAAAALEAVRRENLMYEQMAIDQDYFRCMYGDDPYDESYKPDLWTAIGWASRSQR